MSATLVARYSTLLNIKCVHREGKSTLSTYILFRNDYVFFLRRRPPSPTYHASKSSTPCECTINSNWLAILWMANFSEHPVHILIFPPLFLFTRQIPIIFLLTKMTGYAIDRLPIIVVFCFQIENVKQILSWGLSRWSLLLIACISNNKVQGT